MLSIKYLKAGVDAIYSDDYFPLSFLLWLPILFLYDVVSGELFVTLYYHWKNKKKEKEGV